MFARRPGWVSAPPAEAGSIDPLGYQSMVDVISNRILPGVTVFTTRIRYLSFLAWALRETTHNNSEIDRWDVALSIGEFQRHQGEENCKYPGVLLLKQREFGYRDRLPPRLHNPPVRTRYMGLLRSCGFLDGDDNLTNRGDALADEFDKRIPNRMPKTVGSCGTMPCLSKGGRVELRRLHEGFLEAGTEEARRRRDTLHEVGKLRLHSAISDGSPKAILCKYLRTRGESDTARSLHKAALLELEALPRTLLFHHLYKHGDVLHGRLPKTARLVSPYAIPSVEEGQNAFLSAVASHLQCAERMGGRKFLRDLRGLKRELIVQHYSAKPDGPWVDEHWRQLRKGLAPRAEAGIHGFRMRQFASLLDDLNEI
jgi:hypothetical protein